MPKTTSKSYPLVRTLFLIAIAGIVSTLASSATHVIRADEKGPTKAKDEPADKDKKAQPAGEFGQPKKGEAPVGEFGQPPEKPVDPAAIARAKMREEFEKLKNLKKPLLPLGADDTFKRYRSYFQKALSAGTPAATLSKPQKGIFKPTLKTHLDVITDGIKYWVYRFAEIAERENLPQLSREFLNSYIRLLAKNLKGAPGFGPFREQVFKLVSDNCRDLLSNNFYVRLHALYLVAQLDVIVADRDIQPFTYVGSHELLLEVINDTDQHLALRVAALKGLQRILYSNAAMSQAPGVPPIRITELTKDQRHDIVASVVTLLQQPGQHIWFQRQLVQALGMCQVVRTAGNAQVDVVAVLRQVLTDRQMRHWTISAEASHAISQLPLGAADDIDGLVFDTLVLETQMIGAFNNEPPPKSFFWKRCFGLMYLTYKPPAADQRRRVEGLVIKATEGPLAAKKAKIVESVYPVMREVLKDMLKETPLISPATLQLLNAALKANKPAQAAAGPNPPRVNPATPPRGNPAAARLPTGNVATASIRNRS